MYFNNLNNYLMTHSGDEHKIREYVDFLHATISKAPEEMRDQFYEEMEDFLDNIDHEKIATALGKMNRRDGGVGMKWSCDETESVVHQYDVCNRLKALGKEYSKDCWWFAMNYAYAVHHSVAKSVSNYVDIAIDEFTNPVIKMKHIVREILKHN